MTEPQVDIDTTTLAIAIVLAILVGAFIDVTLGAFIEGSTPQWLPAVLFFGLLVVFYWLQGRR